MLLIAALPVIVTETGETNSVITATIALTVVIVLLVVADVTYSCCC